jgi:hypothetical protein
MKEKMKTLAKRIGFLEIKKFALRIVLVATLLCASTVTFSVTGNEYRKLPAETRQGWIAGVADGIMTSQLMISNLTPPLAKCLGDLDQQQIRVIFETALEQSPDRWHFPAAFTFFQTFNKFCGIR